MRTQSYSAEFLCGNMKLTIGCYLIFRLGLWLCFSLDIDWDLPPSLLDSTREPRALTTALASCPFVALSFACDDD